MPQTVPVCIRQMRVPIQSDTRYSPPQHLHLELSGALREPAPLRRF